MHTSLPIKSLLVFDAVMQSNSFSLAAEQLFVTPGAVGQQIRKLEEWLGVTLFHRQVRQVEATQEAKDYWERIRPALADILSASQSLKDSQSNAVWISMPPGFAAKWFSRHMADFVTRYPDIELHISASSQLADFSRDRLDLAIRCFDGRDDSLLSRLLFDDKASAYCHPGYAQSKHITEPDHIRHATLLHNTLHPYWALWLTQFTSLNTSQQQTLSGIHFDQTLLAIEAAKQGQGIVLTSPLLVEEEIREGRLEPLFTTLSLPLDKGFYVVHPRQRTLRPAVAVFRDWLLERMAG
ncbi:LysR substrate-binding domain-containing protein [Pokkaliibacter sp. MBI-7]|uniref:LysR substrate-binding domain-containing protein n=1 Tax=Pokkaliibacter sp. MBI-7 TaxID=3040600 RepID=UPI002448F26C|nr:LysR substrate-binding domain-containing protein [Pokkaliibacter sp. MBI-7]MDH2435332.1 LysR substrate-binding domain-containing protein [Pokkaliibacter sp. MBI-7]